MTRDWGAETDVAARWCQDEPDNPAAWEALRGSIWYLLKTHVTKVRIGHSYLDFDDLMQESWLVVVAALSTWDRRREVRFTTYGLNNLQFRLNRHVACATGPLRVPVNLHGARARVRCGNAERAACAEAGLKPAASLDFRGGSDITTIELAAPEPEDLGPDDRDVATRAVIAKRMEAMRRHCPKIAEVVSRRYPAEGDRELFREIGATLGLTRARVHQMEVAGLRMLATGVIWPEGQWLGAVRVDVGHTFDREDAA